MKPKALILQARGSNRDLDMLAALQLAGADPLVVPLNDLRARRAAWGDFQMLVLPGGFSYADALGAGKLLALDLISYFADEIAAFAAALKPVMGVCNGFQALVKAGLLPGVTGTDLPDQDPQATLTFNEAGHFECRWVNLLPISQNCLWTKGLTELIACPVAHGEGRFTVMDQSLWSKMALNDQVALTYVLADGSPAFGAYPANPNGSALDIAGVCNPSGNVLGLMPHPENHIHAYQHPNWTRGLTGQSGLPLFENGVRYLS